VTTKVAVINWKNLVVIIKFGRAMVQSEHYLGRVGFLRRGNEGVEVEGGTCRPLPPLDGRNLTI